MPEAMAAVPFVALRETLHRIRQEYDIAEVSMGSLPDEEAALQYVLAKRKPGDQKPPASIELWADPLAGLLHRIVFHGAKTRGRPQPQRVTLDLVSTDDLPADWFAHPSHHDPDVEIERVD